MTLVPIRLKPNRRFPSIPNVADTLQNHTEVLTAIKEAVEVGKRDTPDVLNSYVRVKDLVDMGFATLQSGLLVPAEFATGGGTGRKTATAITSVGNVLTVDHALGDYFTLALSEDITSWSITNLPGSGFGTTLMFRITQDSTPRTVAWPASFLWAGGVAGAVSTGSGDVDVLAITTFDNGTTWMATLAKEFA